MDKRIITWKWGNNPTHNEYTSSRGFIFSGGYGKRLSDYRKLADEAKKDFPFLTDDEIEIGKVSESTYMKGFAFVEFALDANTTHPGYTDWNRFDFYR